MIEQKQRNAKKNTRNSLRGVGGAFDYLVAADDVNSVECLYLKS